MRLVKLLSTASVSFGLLVGATTIGAGTFAAYAGGEETQANTPVQEVVASVPVDQLMGADDAASGDDAGEEAAAVDIYDGWELEKEKNGIRVFMKQEEGKRFKSYLVDAVVPGSPATVDKVVRDVSGMPDWWGKIKTAKQLKQISENEYLVYMVYNMPLFYSDRDFVQHAKAEFDDAGNVIVRIENAADQYPEQKRMKRVMDSYQIWRMEAVDTQNVKIILQGNTDIGDDIPVGMANSMMPDEQISMVSGLIDAVKKAQK